MAKLHLKSLRISYRDGWKNSIGMYSQQYCGGECGIDGNLAKRAADVTCKTCMKTVRYKKLMVAHRRKFRKFTGKKEQKEMTNNRIIMVRKAIQ